MTLVPNRSYPVKPIVVNDTWTPPKNSPEYAVLRQQLGIKRYLAAIELKQENERKGWK